MKLATRTRAGCKKGKKNWFQMTGEGHMAFSAQSSQSSAGEGRMPGAPPSAQTQTLGLFGDDPEQAEDRNPGRPQGPLSARPAGTSQPAPQGEVRARTWSSDPGRGHLGTRRRGVWSGCPGRGRVLAGKSPQPARPRPCISRPIPSSQATGRVRGPRTGTRVPRWAPGQGWAWSGLSVGSSAEG